MMELPLEITTFRGTKPQGQLKRTTLGKLLKVLSTPQHVASKLDAPAWSPTLYEGNYRTLANAKRAHLLVLDIDNKSAPHTTIEEALSVWPGQLIQCHTSYSHTPQHPKFRLVIPQSRATTREDHNRLWRWAVHRHAEYGQRCDLQCGPISQHWFFGTPTPEHFRAVTQEGVLLDVDAVLAEIAAEEEAIGEAVYTVPSTQRVASNADTPFGAYKLRQAVTALQLCPEGEGHERLRQWCRTIGGYVAGGELTESTALNALEAAISGWGGAEANHVRRIRDFFAYGLTAPISAPHHRVSTDRRKRADSVPVPDDAPWEDAVPLGIPLEAMPDLPIEMLPSVLKEWAHAESVATQTPIGMAALMALACCGLALQRQLLIEIRAGWTQPLNLYVVCVLKPGSRKSAVFADATDALSCWEREQAERLQDSIAQAGLRAKIAKSRAEKAAKAADNSNEETTAIDAALSLDAEARRLEAAVPVAPRLITSDCTPEAMAKLMAAQQSCIGVLSAEGTTVMSIALGRYDRRSKANADLLLAAHAGDSVTVDRANGGHVVLDKARATVALTVQPAVLLQLAEAPELAGLGFLARFMWLYPASTVGYREIRPPAVPLEVKQGYHGLLRDLLDRYVQPTAAEGEGAEKFTVMRMSQEADDLMAAFEWELEPQLRPDQELEPIADWASKLAGHAARLAGIIHAVEHRDAPAGTPVSASTVQRAITICRALIPHAYRVLTHEASPERPDAAAERLLEWCKRTAAKSFTRRQVQQGLRRGMPPEKLDQAITTLIETGWIRQRLPDNGSVASTYAVHPSLHAGAEWTATDLQELSDDEVLTMMNNVEARYVQGTTDPRAN